MNAGNCQEAQRESLDIETRVTHEITERLGGSKILKPTECRKFRNLIDERHMGGSLDIGIR